MRAPHFFKTFEIFSVSVFTIEYILRVWTANLHPEYQNPVTGRLRYMVSPMALINLMALAPFLFAHGYEYRFTLPQNTETVP